jgi:hypothetical protein
VQQAVIIKKQESYNTQLIQVHDALVHDRFKKNTKTFKQRAYKQNFSELTEENYNVAW